MKDEGGELGAGGLGSAADFLIALPPMNVWAVHGSVVSNASAGPRNLSCSFGGNFNFSGRKPMRSSFQPKVRISVSECTRAQYFASACARLSAM